MPTISILVPNYNHSKYLVERLESIFNQTYQDYELILLDDCSTDESWSIILTYANHPQVSYKNIGFVTLDNILILRYSNSSGEKTSLGPVPSHSTPHNSHQILIKCFLFKI